LDEGEALVLEQLVRTGLHVQLDERRLVVEQLLLRRRAGHLEVNNALRLRGKLGLLWCERIFGGARFGSCGRGAPHDLRQSHRPDAGLASLQEMAAGTKAGAGEERVHDFVSTPSRFNRTLPITVQAAISAASASLGSGPSGSVASSSAAFVSC